MASISNVSLSLSSGNVTVSGTMQFDSGEVGKSFRLAIKLFGEDKAGDNLPPSDSVGDDEIYAFVWGSNIFNQKPYKQFTIATAGPQPFTETRALSEENRDEDSGNVMLGNSPPVPMMRADEIYASVTLSGSPVSKRSATVVSPGV